MLQELMGFGSVEGASYDIGVQSQSGTTIASRDYTSLARSQRRWRVQSGLTEPNPALGRT